MTDQTNGIILQRHLLVPDISKPSDVILVTFAARYIGKISDIKEAMRSLIEDITQQLNGITIHWQIRHMFPRLPWFRRVAQKKEMNLMLEKTFKNQKQGLLLLNLRIEFEEVRKLPDELRHFVYAKSLEKSDIFLLYGAFLAIRIGIITIIVTVLAYLSATFFDVAQLSISWPDILLKVRE